MDDVKLSADDLVLLKTAAARDAIRHVMSVYNNAGDRGDLDTFVGTFTPDGTFEVYGRRYQGREEIRGFAQVSPQRLPAADGHQPVGRHHVTTSRIEITGPATASGWTYWIYTSDGLPTSAGLYVDAFVKVDGQWLIASRRVKLDNK